MCVSAASRRAEVCVRAKGTEGARDIIVFSILTFSNPSSVRSRKRGGGRGRVRDDVQTGALRVGNRAEWNHGGFWGPYI